MRRSATPAVTKLFRNRNRFLALACVAALAVWGVQRLNPGRSAAQGATSTVASLFFNEKTPNAEGTLRVATWNVASINNNPFEYWVSGAGETYMDLMTNFARVIEKPGEHEDLEVREVFTDEMVDQLFYEMEHAGWRRLKETRAVYDETIQNRKIISGFLKDKSIGEKRLISMFDRVTNTISTATGAAYRPTVVNCYSGPMADVRVWWKSWIEYVFINSVDVSTRDRSGAAHVETKLVREMLSPITRSKYPALTDDEENMSIPLQTLHCAIFDAILAYVLNNIEPGWEDIRRNMCNKLNFGKNRRTLDIIADTYGTHDVVFLQEVSVELMGLTKNHRVAGLFDVHLPAGFDADRNQNSVVFLRKGVWDLVQEPDTPPTAEGTAPGDLFTLTARHVPSGASYFLASFHGDTNGLLTIPVVSAVLDHAGTRRLLMGLDANTYEVGDKKRQGVTQFADYFVSKDVTSCWGENPSPRNFTTFNARTHLQSQLNKAISMEQRFARGDHSPKDFILFKRPDFQLASTVKDNTGSRRYLEDTVFPTLQFPSDHGIVSSVLRVR